MLDYAEIMLSKMHSPFNLFYYSLLTSAIWCLLGEIAQTQYLYVKNTFQKSREGSSSSVLSKTKKKPRTETSQQDQM